MYWISLLQSEREGGREGGGLSYGLKLIVVLVEFFKCTRSKYNFCFLYTFLKYFVFKTPPFGLENWDLESGDYYFFSFVFFLFFWGQRNSAGFFDFLH